MSERKKRIKNLERYGSSGWQWKIKNTKYRTNGNGEGLWTYAKTGAVYFGYKGEEGKPVRAWKQIQGTTQFSLSKDRTKAYNKIYYEFIKKKY